MKNEILSAVNFIGDILKRTGSKLSEERLNKFKEVLGECLWKHYRDHWYPDRPIKGSGYRCIRINGKLDPLIEKAGALIGLFGQGFFALFPAELTLWIDPAEVAYRIGENGSICVIYGKSVEHPSPVKLPETPAKMIKLPDSPPATPLSSSPPQRTPPRSPPMQHHSHFQSLTPPSSPVNTMPNTMSPLTQYQLAILIQLQNNNNNNNSSSNNNNSNHCKDSYRAFDNIRQDPRLNWVSS